MTHPVASTTPPLPAGATHTVTLTVGPRDLASAHAAGDGEAYPDVLSTPAVVALLERACAALLRPLLAEGELSVGARMTIAHTAPTPPGMEVRGRAEFLRQEQRLFLFRVQAEDAAGVIATGEHARAIVPRARVEAAARQRGGAA